MRQIVGAVAAKSLPIVFMLMNVPLVVEPLVRHHSLRDAWQGVYLPLLFGEPVLVAIGIFAAILIVRPLRFEHLGRHIAAAVIAVAALIVVSIFNQGAHMPFIIGASVAAGLLAGIVSFGSFAPRRAAAAQ